MEVSALRQAKRSPIAAVVRYLALHLNPHAMKLILQQEAEALHYHTVDPEEVV